MNFTDFCKHNFDAMEATYRMRLAEVCNNYSGPIKGLYTELISVKVPPMQKYEGATDEDKKAWAAMKKPNFKLVMEEYLPHFTAEEYSKVIDWHKGLITEKECPTRYIKKYI